MVKSRQHIVNTLYLKKSKYRLLFLSGSNARNKFLNYSIVIPTMKGAQSDNPPTRSMCDIDLLG